MLTPQDSEDNVPMISPTSSLTSMHTYEGSSILWLGEDRPEISESIWPGLSVLQMRNWRSALRWWFFSGWLRRLTHIFSFCCWQVGSSFNETALSKRQCSDGPGETTLWIIRMETSKVGGARGTSWLPYLFLVIWGRISVEGLQQLVSHSLCSDKEEKNRELVVWYL